MITGKFTEDQATVVHEVLKDFKEGILDLFENKDAARARLFEYEVDPKTVDHESFDEILVELYQDTEAFEKDLDVLKCTLAVVIGLRAHLRNYNLTESPQAYTEVYALLEVTYNFRKEERDAY